MSVKGALSLFFFFFRGGLAQEIGHAGFEEKKEIEKFSIHWEEIERLVQVHCVV